MISEEQLHTIDNHIHDWLKGLDELMPSLISDLKTDTKSSRFDLVTNVDETIEARFETFLKTHYPDHQLYGEEFHHQTDTLKTGHTWVIDPIDGTANLVKQLNDFCVILGYFIDGQPVLSYIYDYARQHIYKAVRGYGAFVNGEKIEPAVSKPLKDMIVSFNNKVMNDQTIHALLDQSFGYRLIGACGLDSIRVITGQFGAHIHTNAKPWDIGAQFLFAHELGLKMTNFKREGIDFTQGGPFIISNPGCYDEILDILNSDGGYQKV
ncbi:inositol monophosphatase [Staphylococcus felis]|uniref:Inositol monophosphatase n=1 Tax=Staphylococcus felis TaxID=46127 RepID=A0AAX1RXU7_9STAP|nr:inositol monophosphatase family protein [Staphylococcus felis]MBH9581094.1 inositol monophosphatase family protein [Staphylococcus felis]MDM8327984.1 inositol monophosphatase family protein [Staphylococcus felis]REH78682.1 inositol monophosphatase [Staphylococcus felis]REH84363.1 inositol monophosphatase [Staphylococcus felis]REH87908.1 inositol monophosphatase [Staphylococcus felis]